MIDVAPQTAVEWLEYLHESLDLHFSELSTARQESGTRSPVFALEHNLPPDDLNLLMSAVRVAVKEGLDCREWQWWLPFVVYAAESGYDYAGAEFWGSFEQSTPGWHSDHRRWIKAWFQTFAGNYGGAVPTGAFASNFTIIAWPITHAVLPTYLQRQLAQLLYEFSAELTTELLNDPATLGTLLAHRASTYTERFRIFCENTRLVGQVAAALLSGDDEPTPSLTAAALHRIVRSLSAEQQARHWLMSARRSASQLRGSHSQTEVTDSAPELRRKSRQTYPRLFLRGEARWTAHAELPDLSSLRADFPGTYEQLRTSRATVDGGVRPVPPSALLYPGQEMQLATWPNPEQPFFQLLYGDEATNKVLADHCSGITRGPWWLFYRQSAGIAVEIKGKFVRPGRSYLLVGAKITTPPMPVPWCVEVEVDVHDARAYELSVPEQVNESEAKALRGIGLEIISHIAISPVGVVARARDDEAEADWLAGEPVTLRIWSDLLPQRCQLFVDATAKFLDWAPGDAELLFTVEDLAVGTHEIRVTLLGANDRRLGMSSIAIRIRDPLVRPECGTTGEGIRMLCAPARPTLNELWDGRSILTIDGPPGADAELRVALRDDLGNDLAQLQRSVRLPVDESCWKAISKSIRTNHRYRNAYDQSESCVVTISRDGVGFAALTCERGFQPLRWHFARSNDGKVVATLVDRTDGGDTYVDFFDVEEPTAAVRKDAGVPLDVPPRGGLAVARAGPATAATILPTDPNAVRQLAPARPVVSPQARRSEELLRLAQAHNQWGTAALPADPFAVHPQRLACQAIARAIGAMVGGRHWAKIEHRLAVAADPVDLLGAMQDAVGTNSTHKAIASNIAFSLYKWSTPEALLRGFGAIAAPHLARSGIPVNRSTLRFILMLADQPGSITGEWEASQAAPLIDRILHSPVLYRAARFAVLGTRALNDADGLWRVV
ncbi:hypothetical protein ACIA8C_04765 [Nocardia sp. NPDC051321]|uniref:hypothetical protein n=1 Tax=Nocardia sp. NPDC051321 TaxID=3364323 RepID=UPI00378B721B